MIIIITLHLSRKLILFFVTFGVFLCCGGVSLILLHHYYQEEHRSIRPLIVIGKQPQVSFSVAQSYLEKGFCQ